MTEQDANIDESVGTEKSAPESSSVSSNLRPIEDDDGFVSTVEFEEVEEVDDTEDTTSDDAEQNTSQADTSDKKDFHEHPRFKELIEEKNKLAERLAKLEAAKEEKPDQKRPPGKSFKNIMEMDDDTIVDKITSAPKQFLANFAQQLAYEFKSDLEAEARQRDEQMRVQTTQQTAIENMREFFKDKEDGIAMLKDGTIKQFIETNPGHNPISAYHALVGEKAFETRLQKAIEKEREKINRELKAAGKIRPVKSSSATPASKAGPVKVAENKSDLKRILLEKARSRRS